MNSNDLERRIQKAYEDPILAPDPCAIEDTIRMAQVLAAEQPKRTSLVAFVRDQFRFITPSTWALQLLVLLCFALGANQLAGSDYAGIFLSVSSICVVVVCSFDLFRNQEQGMLELEASCRHNYRHIIIARMIAFALIDVVTITLLIVAYGTLAAINPLECILYATVPFFACAGGCLTILSLAPKNAGSLLSVIYGIFLAVLLVGCAYSFPSFYFATSVGLWFTLFAITLAGLVIQVVRVSQNTSRIIDRHLAHHIR